MTSITVWLLVGYIHWNTGAGPAPQTPHATKESCEASVRVISNLASHSRLACVQAEIPRAYK
jgi:hypothetical protein